MCQTMKLNKSKRENDLVFLLTVHHSDILCSFIEYILYIYIYDTSTQMTMCIYAHFACSYSKQ